jgi:hypothetical protein
MNEYERGWLVAILEGEGCFSVHRSSDAYPAPYIKIAMIDRDVVEHAARLLVSAVTRVHPPSYKVSGRKPQYVAAKSGKPAVAVIRDLYPFLSKRRQAQIDKVMSICDPDGLRYLEGVEAA